MRKASMFHELCTLVQATPLSVASAVVLQLNYVGTYVILLRDGLPAWTGNTQDLLLKWSPSRASTNGSSTTQRL
ncbi:hypothetical protein C8R44DRAFT_989049 [Mycena epipterygia]|nr:hypothetical protein C8R44DRAFT_989049 [Mycena epipterygia]